MALGNQQERSAELSFAGGLIVGEGCFTVTLTNQVYRKSERRDSAVFRPVFTITMDDTETMERFIEILQNHDLAFYVHKTKRGSLVATAQGYKRVKRLTETLIPYLTGNKKKVALLVDEFIASRLAGYAKQAPTEEQIQLLERIWEHNGNRKRKYTAEILRDYTPYFGKQVTPGLSEMR